MSEVLPAPAVARRVELGPSLFAGLACLGDIVLLRGWLSGQFAMVEVIALHSGLALALGALAHLAQRRPSQSVLVRVLVLLLFGPLGGPALMIAAPAAHAARRPAADAVTGAASRVTSTSRTEDLFNQIRQGRRHPLPQQPPGGFLEIFRAGTLQQQQEAIAAISRAYHPEMRPALGAALASPVPALRVQAAAVYAKLRGTHEARAKELLASGEAGVPPSAPDFAAECARVAQSGFVDGDTQRRLRELSLKPGPSAPSPVSVPDQRLPRWEAETVLQPAPRLRRYACGGLA